ncbi:MAG: hypothetical protein Q7J07_05815 [Pelolinea sp.]|nr:hypothetical protein [Pelolinea sp.]
MNHKKGIFIKPINRFTLFLNTKLFVYGWLLLLCILSFGILIPKLGFYWDDLPYLYQHAAFGPQGFPDFVASDRPFSAWIFSATTFLFGFNPIGYHILALILRWICAVLFYEIIRLVWKENNKIFFLTASSIFTIYPGFLQQPIALIYIHHFIVFVFFLLSIYFMIINKLRGKISFVFTFVSVILSLGMFSIENFATLEMIRPLILWKISNRLEPEINSRQRLSKTLRSWTPYLAIFIFFVYWRVAIFRFPTYKPTFLSILLENPTFAVQSLISRIPKDLFTVTVGAWTRSFQFPSVSEFGTSATYLLWVLLIFSMLASVTIFFLLSGHEKQTKDPNISKNFLFEVFVSSLILFFLSGSIVWILDLPLEIEFAWDRMTIAFLPSIALLTAGLISCINKPRIIQALLISTVISFAIGSHFENGISYKRDWENLQNFIWQLSWRVPSLSENSILIASDVGLRYYSDSSLTAPVNLSYLENITNNKLSYLVYFSDARHDLWFENEVKDQEIKKGYRSFQFNGNSSNVIAFLFEPPGCLKILDRTYSNSITNPNLSFRQVKEISFSNIDLITPQLIHIPYSELFSEKSSDNWCYYFEKADLARQYGDYKEIERLGNMAINANYFPRVASEWLPFLEGYVWRGNWGKSKWIAENIQSADGNYSNGLCYTLNRILKNPDFLYKKELSESILSYNCP